MKNCLYIIALTLGLSGIVSAQPSMYYQWHNKTTNAKICDPENPGPQWEKVGGPFSDANCSIKMPE